MELPEDYGRHEDKKPSLRCSYSPSDIRYSKGSSSPSLRLHKPHEDLKDSFEKRPWRCGDPYQYNAPVDGNSWQKCHQLVDKYDDEMCEAWKEEVDKLLIFAGLFSAAVTAFTIESYKWLQQDSQEISAHLLAYIALQLGNSSTSEMPIFSSISPQPTIISASDVRINVLWFLSLTLSLTTVLVGILCLQWLREYRRDAALPHKDAVALRQMRYEGLLQWHVPEILSTLPLLLQLSLILFFSGLLDLLWSLNSLVASCVSVVVGFVMLFLVATTIIPALQHALVKDKYLHISQCPYKSPQSWLFLRLGLWFLWVLDRLDPGWSSSDSTRLHRLLKSAGDLNWMTYDMRWRHIRDAGEVLWGTPKKMQDSQDIIHSLQWLNTTFTQSVDVVYPIHQSILDLEVNAAASTVSGMYTGGQIDNATFRVMIYDRYSPTRAQKRDVISTFYLHLHQDTHPILKNSYIESVIRVLNSQDVPRPFFDWLSEILQELAMRSSSSLPSSTVATHADDPIIISQVLLCVKALVSRNLLRNLDVELAWTLLTGLLSRGPKLVAGGNQEYLPLAYDIFEVMEYWLTTARETERVERVRLCAEGIMNVFSREFVENYLFARDKEKEDPNILRVISLVYALDAHIMGLGGVANVLQMYHPWQENSAAHDWTSFTHHIKHGIEGLQSFGVDATDKSV